MSSICGAARKLLHEQMAQARLPKQHSPWALVRGGNGQVQPLGLILLHCTRPVCVGLNVRGV
jgi:hypothetical protein